MRSARSTLTLSVAAILVASIVLPAWAKPVSRTRARFANAAKIAGELPKGKADWRVDNKSRKRLKIRMQHLPGSSVNVMACGTNFGAVPVNALGKAKLTRKSKRGDTVPTCAAGATVTVTGSSGLNMNGTFADK